jgi:hypothetical protein
MQVLRNCYDLEFDTTSTLPFSIFAVCLAWGMTRVMCLHSRSELRYPYTTRFSIVDRSNNNDIN